MQKAKKLKQEEKKVILAYAQLKLKANRLAKELDTMKQNVVDCFQRTNQNLIIVTDTHGNNFGLQKINRKRKKFETANFKIAHNDLFNKFCTEIQYQEYKAIGGIDGLQAPKEQSDDEQFNQYSPSIS